MRLYKNKFDGQSNYFVSLLEMAFKDETFYYGGTKCKVSINPAFSQDEIEKFKTNLPVCAIVHPKSHRCNKMKESFSLNGYLTYSKYKFIIIDEKFEMIVRDKDNHCVDVTMIIQSNNLHHQHEFTSSEYAEKHADEKEGGCSIM